jgi:hypothetical protein
MGVLKTCKGQNGQAECNLWENLVSEYCNHLDQYNMVVTNYTWLLSNWNVARTAKYSKDKVYTGFWRLK